ncbi:protein-disulfide reductase DsbD, partial [Methylophaga lonarensis]|uniref:protein-disulfide reductase DsbD n=1 Tax=Methylophaga lonarensis TaxID=999151 RepID=UPI003D26DC1B
KGSEVVLNVSFQGCSETFQICYPPATRTVSLELTGDAVAQTQSDNFIDSASTLPSTSSTGSQEVQIAERLADGNLLKILLGFFGLGLLLTFTPCVLPMIPILSSIIVGQGEHITTRRAFLLSLTYVLAMSLTYTAAGVVSGMLGSNLQLMLQNPWLIGSFTIIFVLLALSMFGFYELQLPSGIQQRLYNLSQKQRGGTWIGVAIMGLLSGLIVGPCLAPPLAGALLFISQHADPVLGGAALFAMSMGMGVPLLIIGTSAGSILPKAGDWMVTIKAVFGVLLLALAIWMLERIIPGWLTLLLWGALLIISAVYLGALESLGIDANGWQKLWKGVGLLMLIYGSLLVLGASSGGQHIWQPLHALAATERDTSSQAPSVEFVMIDSLEQLDQQLQSSTKPVMLDFYADWCTDCKTMELTTFRDPQVVSALQQYTLLKVDLTDNTSAHQAMLRELRVFGPPTFIFYDAFGEELRQYRQVGHIRPGQMRDLLAELASEINR